MSERRTAKLFFAVHVTRHTMKTLTVTRAGEFAGRAPEEVTLIFTGQPPDEPLPLYEFDARFAADAELIATTLMQTLPGGTLDRVIAKLLECRASLFTRAFHQPNE